MSSKRELYFEDFFVGQEFSAGPVALSVEDSVAFAREFDPQYFHIDEQAAKGSTFGRLIASGWHTAALTMKLKAQTELVNVKGGLLGMGLEELKWPRPVFPPDALSLRITVTGVRASASRPSHGVVTYAILTTNQRGEPVMEGKTAVWVPKRAQ